jgi:CBS domain-containing protein
MAPLDLDNLEAAQQLSSKYEIKHVPINFLTMMLVDGKQLFMFTSPPVDDWTSEALFPMGDTYYTNDPKSIEKVSEMLNDAWKRGMEIAQITAQPGMKLPTVEVENAEIVPNLISAMLKNNVNSVLVTENHQPIGVITDRELLREIGENKKNLGETLTRDIKYTPLITLDAGESVSNALKTMRKKGATRIAVVKNGQLVGMLTEELGEATQKNLTPKPRAVKK